MSKTPSIYDIKQEFYAIQELLENTDEVNEETGEVTDNSELVQSLLSEIEANQEQKADNIAFLVQEAENNEAAIANEIVRLQKRKKMFQNEQSKLKDLITFLLAGEKLKTNKHTFSYRSSTSVSILDESALPAEFLIVKETFTPDKKAIGIKLKEFEEVAGATLVTKKSLTIK